jgi:hypothetical protein
MFARPTDTRYAPRPVLDDLSTPRIPAALMRSLIAEHDSTTRSPAGLHAEGRFRTRGEPDSGDQDRAGDVLSSIDFSEYGCFSEIARME